MSHLIILLLFNDNISYEKKIFYISVRRLDVIKYEQSRFNLKKSCDFLSNHIILSVSSHNMFSLFNFNKI